MSAAAARLSGEVALLTTNSGKIREFRLLSRPWNIALRDASELALEDVEETGASFEANARIKAHAGMMQSGLACLADDSGFCVAGLDGAPGIYSARWAGRPRDFGRAMRKVHDALHTAHPGFPEQAPVAAGAAWFVSVLCLCRPDGRTHFFRGEIHGRFIWPPRGTKGFGYDPVFLPGGHQRSFGEMSMEEKLSGADGTSGLSHRARAFDRFADALLERR